MVPRHNRSTPPGSPIAVELSGRMSQRNVHVAGTAVQCWDYSPAEVSAATRTIVMVHGFRGDHHGLERVVELLPQHHVIMPDLPGFGRSPAFAHTPHDVSGYTHFLDGLLNALGLGGETVLLGHSFGSIVVSHFVAAQPQRVYPLILVNPIASPALEGPKGLLTKLAVLYYWAAAKLPARLGQALLRSKIIVHLMSVAMAKTRDPALLAFIHEQHHAYFSDFASRDMLLEAFQASVAGTVREVATALTLPTLLIAGSDDEIAPLPRQRQLVEMLPDAELVVIEGVGHLIHYETPHRAALAINDFLERHPAP